MISIDHLRRPPILSYRLRCPAVDRLVSPAPDAKPLGYRYRPIIDQSVLTVNNLPMTERYASIYDRCICTCMTEAILTSPDYTLEVRRSHDDHGCPVCKSSKTVKNTSQNRSQQRLPTDSSNFRFPGRRM